MREDSVSPRPALRTHPRGSLDLVRTLWLAGRGVYRGAYDGYESTCGRRPSCPSQSVLTSVGHVSRHRPEVPLRAHSGITEARKSPSHRVPHALPLKLARERDTGVFQIVDEGRPAKLRTIASPMPAPPGNHESLFLQDKIDAFDIAS